MKIKKNQIERFDLKIITKHPWLMKLLKPFLTIKLIRKYQIKLGDKVVTEMLFIPRLVILRENEKNTD